MSSSIVIRAMQTTDISALLEIQSLCYSELVPESDISLLAKRNASPETCFMAERDGVVMGYLISIPWTSTNLPALNSPVCELPIRPDCLYLHDLAVHPEARKFGVGKKLVQTFLDTMSVYLFSVAVLIAVQNSMEYWKRFGFREQIPSRSIAAKLATYGQNVVFMRLG